MTISRTNLNPLCTPHKRSQRRTGKGSSLAEAYESLLLNWLQDGVRKGVERTVEVREGGGCSLVAKSSLWIFSQQSGLPAPSFASSGFISRLIFEVLPQGEREAPIWSLKMPLNACIGVLPSLARSRFLAVCVSFFLPLWDGVLRLLLTWSRLMTAFLPC